MLHQGELGILLFSSVIKVFFRNEFPAKGRDCLIGSVRNIKPTHKSTSRGVLVNVMNEHTNLKGG